MFNQEENNHKRINKSSSHSLQVAFNVSVELTGCLPGPQRFFIKPVGFQDSLELELESLCSCDCQESPETNSSHCSQGQGALECGVCVCEPGYMGPQCECSEESALTSNCHSDSQAELCSGQGECYCGQCLCHTSSFGRVYGPYCECNDYSCVRFRGKLCGGLCLDLIINVEGATIVVLNPEVSLQLV